MRWLVCLAVCCGGCGSLEYRGVSPSFRYTRDDPGINDVYVGADANFVVAERPSSRSLSIAEDRPIDAWNTPVAWQPLTAPVANPTQEAAVSPDPAVAGQ